MSAFGFLVPIAWDKDHFFLNYFIVYRVFAPQGPSQTVDVSQDMTVPVIMCEEVHGLTNTVNVVWCKMTWKIRYFAEMLVAFLLASGMLWIFRHFTC